MPQNTLYPQAWADVLPPEVDPMVQDIVRRVGLCRQEHEIFPPENQVFRALELTPPENVKAVIIGQDPYHGAGQADGLAFSVNSLVKAPPSLVNIMTELSNDVGPFKMFYPDLTPWAKDGVLLLNTCLTVQAHKPTSHNDMGWQEFTGTVLKTVNGLDQPIAFIGWGAFAGKLLDELDIVPAPNRLVLKSSHPSPYSARSGYGSNPAFFGSKPFSKTNDFLEQHGVKTINWLAITNPA